MAAENFQQSLALVLLSEGGKIDDSRDPGGRTNQGVTQAVYDAWRKAKGLDSVDVWIMTSAERDEIYKSRYWLKAGCDQLPKGLDYAVFDFAVNSGVSRAIKTIQTIVGVTADGAFGPNTLAAVGEYFAMYGDTALGDELCSQRMAFLKTLPTYARFGKGWSRRVMGDMDGRQETDTGVIDRAYSMATSGEVQPPEVPTITPKTYLAS
jgi:lysozyme family protein